MFSAAIALQLRGVGHNPDAISSVRGIDGASWNNKWRGLVSETFQVRKAALEAHFGSLTKPRTFSPTTH
jgi:hypothetical protein